MRILLLYYYFLLPYVSPTRAQANEQNPTNLFFKDRTVTWQKSYSGFWDDVIPVKMDLLSDGTECKGYFYFGDGKNKYVLSGTMKQNEIKLEEQDMHSNKTGQLIMHIENNMVRGTWYNASLNFNARISMHEGSTSPEVTYWVKSYASKNDPRESSLLLHKDFSDQINSRFYYRPINKTLFGTAEIKAEDNYSQEARLEDYLHHNSGTLQTWRVNDKHIDVRFKLGTLEYSQSLDLLQQISISQDTYADHWMAVDIKYPRLDKAAGSWFQDLIDSLLIDVQDKKRILTETKDVNQTDRLTFRMSIWPEFDFLNSQWMAGAMHVKNSWDESTLTVPFMIDLKKGSVINYEDLFVHPADFETIKSKWIKEELNKLKTSAALDYQSLNPEDFKLLTIQQEGLAFSAPFDLTYGTRQILIPYAALKDQLSSKYFPL